MATEYVNQTVTNKSELPDWYSSYLQQVMGRAVTQADSTQPPPPTQQIAGLTPDQLAAYQSVRNAQGAAAPYYGAANTNFQNATSMFGTAPPEFTGLAFAGHQNLRAGEGMLTDAAARDTASAAYPYATEGADYISQAGQGSALAGASPYIQASTQPTGLAAASPFLAGAAAPSYANVSSYLNPYNSAVTDQIAQLGARNLSENLLPALSDDFVRAGQYGSTRQRDLVGRTVRDTQAGILNAQTQALQSGYTQALGASQADAARQAQLAGTAGGLGTAQQQALLGAGQATGQLSATDLARLQASGVDLGQLGLGLAGAQATDAARQVASGSALGQLGIGIGQLGLGSAQAQSQAQMQAGQGMLQSGLAQQGLGTTSQNQALAGAAAQEAAGAAQQGVGQANLNSLYNQQQAQYNLPWDTIARLSGVVQGLPVNTSSSSSSTTGTPAPSALSQVAGLGLGVAGLANSGLFKAKGGAVKKKRHRRYSYGDMPASGLGGLYSEAA